MSDVRKIKTALISVYHKDGLDDILSMLHAQGVKFLSTPRPSSNSSATPARP